ncbi:MAG: choice-of-anchor V domain-containing protein [Bacteroidota bacterium]
MKKLITSFFAVAASAIVFSIVLQPQTATSNSSGAPSSGSCTACHGGTLQSSPDLLLEVLDSNLNTVTEYDPGQVYEVYIQMTRPSTKKYGFALSANAGTFGKLLPTDNTIQLKSGYVTHTSSGNTFSDDTASWEMTWTAPSTGTGNIPLQLYINATNNNNSDNLDIIYSKQLVLNQRTTGLEKISTLNHIHVFPQPATQVLNLTYDLKTAQTVQVELTDISGRKVYSSSAENKTAGEHTERIYTSELNKGVYILRMLVGNETLVRKVIVQ